MNPMLSMTMVRQDLIAIARNEAVDDVLWTQVLANWGTAGDPRRRIEVAPEIVLSNLRWLPRWCRQFSTGIDYDQPARRLIERIGIEQKALSEILSAQSAEDIDVDRKLASGRLVRELREFQRRDLGKLLRLANGANFSVPGAGKTTVAYALYEAEKLAGKVDRLLVIAPLSAFDAWREEGKVCFSMPPLIHRFDGRAIPSTCEVCLINYHRLASDYARIASWVRNGNTHIILDEAHRMKRGWSGQWGRACLQLAFLAARRDVLTGTPAPQGLRDLDALFDFVWPTQARRILPATVFQSAPGAATVAETAQSIEPLFVRTTKADLELPKPKFSVISVPLEGLQEDIYHALRNRYAGQFETSRSQRAIIARMGQVSMYLLEAATNPALLPFGSRPDPATAHPRFPLLGIPENSPLTNLIAQYSQYQNPPKFLALADILKRNQQLGRKTLVWTNFVSNIELLEEAFQTLRPAIVHGGVPSEVSSPNAVRTREAELARFRGDPASLLLIANPAALGEGISLHHVCHDAVYLDRTFNAGQYLQSLDRIHRLGMDPSEETRITFLVTAGTIDDTVNARVDAKAARLGQVLDDPAIATMALPDEEDTEDFIEPEDIAAILAHLHGDDSGATRQAGDGA